MMRFRRMLAVLGVVGASLAGPAGPAQAQPSADQVMTEMGLSAGDRQRVVNGEFVTTEVGAVSERDLSFAIAFLLRASPDVLGKQEVAGEHITADSEVQQYGRFSPAGSLADLAGLQITTDEASTLSNAQPGEALNLSTGEIAAFQALRGRAPAAVQQQLQRMLLARYQAYRGAGLAGIAPYDRGGSATEVAEDLRRASQAAKGGLQKYMPAFHAVLLGYPKATVPGMREHFFWVKYAIQGKPTYVLTHVLVAADGVARAVVSRQFYVSTGYNGEQAIAAFLPVQGGTVATYESHAFTDQVAGFGSWAKRSIGSRIMAAQMKKMFEAERRMVR